MLTLLSEFRETCPGCGTGLFYYHGENCDVARCAVTGHQLFSCGIWGEDHDCVNTAWQGFWPGVVECFEHKLFCYFVPNTGFIPCQVGHPEAVADLNRLVSTFSWDAKLQKWMKP